MLRAGAWDRGAKKPKAPKMVADCLMLLDYLHVLSRSYEYWMTIKIPKLETRGRRRNTTWRWRDERQVRSGRVWWVSWSKLNHDHTNLCPKPLNRNRSGPWTSEICLSLAKISLRGKPFLVLRRRVKCFPWSQLGLGEEKEKLCPNLRSCNSFDLSCSVIPTLLPTYLRQDIFCISWSISLSFGYGQSPALR